MLKFERGGQMFSYDPWSPLFRSKFNPLGETERTIEGWKAGADSLFSKDFRLEDFKLEDDY
jgi:hypothetical protein